MADLLRIIVLIFLVHTASGEVSIRQTLILTKNEQEALVETIKNDNTARQYWLEIKKEADTILEDQPNPLEVIHYEGLLDTNPKRVKTEESLEDMDKLGCLLFAYYGSQDKKYADKARNYILAWVRTYQATGNPINENKFEPLIHSYYVMQQYFNNREQEEVREWLDEIARAEMANHDVPMNNWEAKRIKLLSIIGIILNNQEYIDFADDHFKEYIAIALYGDGTTRDLQQRDALSYHVSGLKPLMVYGIILNQCRKNPGLNPFTYQNEKGGSIQKSVEYVNPYALGEKVYKEWVNTQVELDKKRAEAGLEKYQPGRHFKPEKALEMYELAYFFAPQYEQLIKNILDKESPSKYHSWFFLLLDKARSRRGN